MTGPAPFGLTTGARALVVAPHPDDETIGAGGTIVRLTRAGIDVHVLAIGCGATASGEQTTLRVKEFHAACDTLGVVGRHLAWADDRRGRNLDRHRRDLVELIEHAGPESIRVVRPVLVLLPAGGGFHQDHVAVHQAGLAAARLAGAGTPRIVLGYHLLEERWTATGTGLIHVDISQVWPVKRAALRAYTSQLRRPPHPRNVNAIRTADAATGARVGCALAEAHVPLRVLC